MAKKTDPQIPAEEVTNLVEATPDARRDALMRAEACARELGPILAKYRCQIQPRLTQEPVGVAGDKIIMAATFWIAPLV